MKLRKETRSPVERTFLTEPGPVGPRTGYAIIDGDDGDKVIGFAVRADRGWGWAILHPETGECILGLGDSTKVGHGLGDALWVFEQKFGGKS